MKSSSADVGGQDEIVKVRHYTLQGTEKKCKSVVTAPAAEAGSPSFQLFAEEVG